VRTGLAAFSGLLLALSFPKYGIPAFGWIALMPLFVAVSESRRMRAAFRLGFMTGVIYFTGTVYWVTHVMTMYGGLQAWVAVLVNAAMIATLALFPAICSAIMYRLVARTGPFAMMALPIVWVATELGRTYMPHIGFPWVLLGYSQASVLPIAQVASLVGVYGVSMIVAAVNAALVVIAIGPPDRRRFVPAAVMLAVVLGVAVWGSLRLSRSEWTHAGQAIRVGLVQGNVDQAIKWDAAHSSSIFEAHLRLTDEAIAKGAEFVMWPESSMPFLFEEHPVDADRIRTIVRTARVPMLFGSDQVIWRDVGGRRVVDKIYNAAFLVQPDGATGGIYRKIHLVPFGEYVPLKRLLFFAAPLVEAVSDFTAGESLELLPVGTHRVGTAICYEIIYADLVRRSVAAGSEMITTITNDAWFGATSAPYQHFAQASMRAIENGRYLVRSANTGISGIVDPYGRVLEQTPIFQPAVVVGSARFLQTSTFYTRHGDVVAYASVLVTLALLAAAYRRVQ
jgi:apolipoprotein N-acyltransferase